MYDFAGEKMLEVVSDSLDPSAAIKPGSRLVKGEEATGMRRVVEALECNAWANAVKHKVAQESKLPEDEKQAVPRKERQESSQSGEPKVAVPEKSSEEAEDEADEFEKLMEEMMRIKEM